MRTGWREPRFRNARLCRSLAIFLGLTFFVAPGAIWFYSRFAVNSRLESLRAKGLPTTANELNHFYAVPRDVPDATRLWVGAIDAVQAANLHTRGDTLPFIRSGPTRVPVPGEAWDNFEAARALLSELEPELQAIHQAAGVKGQVRFPVDFSAGTSTPLPYTQGSRDVARLLTLDAHVRAHEGKSSQVLHDIKAIFALSDALRREPVLISQLVRFAIQAVGYDAVERLLPHCEWSDDELESLQSAIRSAQIKAELENAFSGERAICLIELDRTSPGPLRPSNVDETLHCFATSIEGLAGSWPEALRQQQVLRTRMDALRQSTFSRLQMSPVLLMLPAFEKVVNAGARADARHKCTDVGIAVWRFRQKYGRTPESLADIDRRLLGGSAAQAPDLTDPFDANVLRYRVEAARIVIYSVGDNGKDDGGECNRDEQGQSVDIGFVLRIPNAP
jgi:hypothetical protein